MILSGSKCQWGSTWEKFCLFLSHSLLLSLYETIPVSTKGPFEQKHWGPWSNRHPWKQQRLTQGFFLNVWKKLSSKKTEPKKNWDVFSWKNWAFWRYFWKILRKKATKLNKSSQKCNLQLSLWRSLLIFQENVKIIGKSSIFPPKNSASLEKLRQILQKNSVRRRDCPHRPSGSGVQKKPLL